MAKRKTKPASRKAKTIEPRKGTKQAKLIEMLERPNGASNAEIQKAFDWQPHTVRGAISGALKAKLGLKVEAERDDARGTVYRIR